MNLPVANILTYFFQSNLAGQAIVVALIVFSALAWTVMVGKYLDLKHLRTQNANFERQLNKTGSILLLDSSAIRGRGPFAQLTHQALEAWYKGRESYTDSSVRLGLAENALQRGVAEVSVIYESKMILLGSIVTGAPFLGLLGTVWGVMDAFGSVAAEGGGTIEVLAPGVSGALLTTVAGLIVAIPSVFGYNYLLTQTKIMVTELENFASNIADRIEIEGTTTKD
jgi:biopolymer transport protein TolQ